MITQNVTPITPLPSFLAPERPAAVDNLVEAELPLLTEELAEVINQINSTETNINNKESSVTNKYNEIQPHFDEIDLVAAAIASGNMPTIIDDADTSASKTWSSQKINSTIDIYTKTEKTTLVDADEIMLADSTSTFSLKKITWASIKTALTSLFTPRVAITTNKAIARYSNTTGNLQNSAITIDDNGNIGSGNQTFNGFGGSGFKNYIINGNFDVWQRGTSQESSVDGLNGYGSDDRWFNQYNTTYRKHTRQICTNTERALFNSAYFSRTATATGGTSGSIVLKKHHIEDVTKLAGKTVTLSFWAKADATKNIAMEVVQVFGTGGSPSAVSDKQCVTIIPLTSVWQKKTITFTIPSIIGKTLGTDGVHTSNTQIRFWLDAGSDFSLNTNSLGNQSGIFDIAQVQLEEGSIATPFENRPYGLELSMCQRYFFIGGTASSGVFASTSTARFNVKLPCEMRVSPSVTPILAPIILNSTVSEAQTGSQTLNFGVTGYAASVRHAVGQIQFGGFSSGEDGRPTVLLNDALSFSAEL